MAELKFYIISANDNIMGEYQGVDINEAIDEYALDAGYDSEADMHDSVPGSSRDDLSIFEINTDKLISAITAATGETVFQDSYGDGVALVQGISYATYTDLAEAFGFEIDNFYV